MKIFKNNNHFEANMNEKELSAEFTNLKNKGKINV